MFSLPFLNKAKDFAVELAVKQWFNLSQNKYGQMTNIKIDSSAKSIRAELALKGEPAPLVIDVKHYDISSSSGETFIELGEIQTSREWINNILADFVPASKKRFKVPAAVRVLL